MLKTIALPCFITTIAIILTTSRLAADRNGDTLSGELIDITCYMIHPEKGKGSDHKECATACVKNGQPMGLLTENGAITLLTADHKNGQPFENLKSWAGQIVEVRGTLAEKVSMTIMVVVESRLLETNGKGKSAN